MGGGLWFGLLLLGLTLAVWLERPTAQSQEISAGAVAIASTMLTVEKAALLWCAGPSGCPDGAVEKSNLALPSGMASASWVFVSVSGGVVSTFVSGLTIAPHWIVSALVRLTAGAPGAGLASAAGVQTPARSGTALAPIAAGVPAGVPVVSMALD